MDFEDRRIYKFYPYRDHVHRRALRVRRGTGKTEPGITIGEGDEDNTWPMPEATARSCYGQFNTAAH